jgi:subtilase family serine protease
MRPCRASFLAFVFFILFSNLSFGVQPDRIVAPLTTGQVVPLRGNVHGMARAQFDQGRVDAITWMSGVSLVFKPSGAQQGDLNKLLAQQQDPSSPKYHKWLTPAQFADRFGMSRNDIVKLTDWLQSQGLTVTRVANSRNQIFFEGPVAQVESAFHTEIHNYLVNGELHYANASAPAVPAALAEMTLGVHNLHNFQPKPRVKVRKMMFNEIHSHLTSHVSGSHFLTPGDFATIYDVQALYSAGIDGAGQTIAVVGQSAVSLNDIHSFRNAAGLAANDPTLLLVPGSGTSTHCAGDEGESDLDLEWTGGVAKNAGVTFVYVGLGTGTTCANRTMGAFDALQYSIDHNVAAFISNSYGLCENANSAIGITQADALTIQGWAQQANTQGQTIVSATGDTGAADCDFGASVAVDGLAVDIPASIPEVTGAGGTAFNGDSPGTVSGTPPNTNVSATPYWSGTTNSVDSISSALSYIPEIAWNDTALSGTLSASGGGASIYFSKPTWQTGTGVPPDGKRDVPDIAVSASPNHDGYLICSPTDNKGNPSCTSGFRDSQTFFDIVGGTSVSAPTFTATLALINQYLVTNGFKSNPGLGNVNSNLYHIATYNPAAFHDLTSGNNIVPCTKGTPSCPTSGTLQFGFSAGTGYDQVTGLGSIDGHELALAWGQLLTPSSTSLSASAPQIIQGINETFTVTVLPSAATGTVTLSTNGSALGTAKVSGGSATFSTTALPPGTNSVIATYNGIFATSASPAVSVTVTPPSYTLSSSVATVAVIAGTSGQAALTITPGNNFPQSITFTCTGLPAESSCIFSPTSVTPNGAAVTDSLSIKTTAPTAQLNSPFEGGGQIFYAVLLPGVLGIVVSGGSRNRVVRGMRLLSLMVVLGFSTLWLGACGNSSTTKDPGTPKGTSPVIVTATTSGANPVTQTVKINLTVN